MIPLPPENPEAENACGVRGGCGHDTKDLMLSAGICAIALAGMVLAGLIILIARVIAGLTEGGA